MTTTITIAGPGGTMDYEVALIQAVLEKAGIKMTIFNNYPSTKYEGKSIDDLISADRDDFIREAVIKVIHQPWGG